MTELAEREACEGEHIHPFYVGKDVSGSNPGPSIGRAALVAFR